MQRDKISYELQNLQIGTNKKINKKSIDKSDEDTYTIDGRTCNLEEAITAIVGDSRQVVLFKEPFSNRVVGQFAVRNKTEISKLITSAKQKNVYMYYAPIQIICGEEHIGYPHVIEWDSVPENKTAKQKNPLECPYCNKAMTSTPGRTLHVKSKHPEKYDEYMGGGPNESE